MVASTPTLRIAPFEGLIDADREIVVEGLLPGEVVSIAARTVRGSGPWRAAARFRADAEGRIDLGRDAPLSGSYAGASAAGLIWSQAPDDPGARLDPSNAPVGGPLVTRFAIRRAEEEVATAEMIQLPAASGVRREEIREEGLVATLFTPPGSGPHPLLMILNGSNGGINEPHAALFASHGFAALALGYFNVPGRSPYISETHLEYFEIALAWAHRAIAPARGFLGLVGRSRGGELALLLGSLFPEAVSAVVGYVPGAFVHSAQNACDPALGRDGPAWVFRGRPLPHLWQNNRTASWAAWDDGPEPRRHTHALLTALGDPEAMERARIPVERIAGPVALVSGGDDGSWPSSLYSRLVMDRLARFGHPHPVMHLDYPEAGHAIHVPHIPTSQLVYTHPVSGRLSTSGGSAEANAAAARASWPKVLEFLTSAASR